MAFHGRLICAWALAKEALSAYCPGSRSIADLAQWMVAPAQVEEVNASKFIRASIMQANEPACFVMSHGQQKRSPECEIIHVVHKFADGIYDAMCKPMKFVHHNLPCYGSYAPTTRKAIQRPLMWSPTSCAHTYWLTMEYEALPLMPSAAAAELTVKVLAVESALQT